MFIVTIVIQVISRESLFPKPMWVFLAFFITTWLKSAFHAQQAHNRQRTDKLKSYHKNVKQKFYKNWLMCPSMSKT